MTISSTTFRNQYTADGVVTTFPYTFRIIQASDIIVILTDPTTGIDTVQNLTTNYTLTGVDNPAGGNVVFVSVPANGLRVTLARRAQAVQPEHYVENDPFPAASHELALDRATTVNQTALEQCSRSLQVPYGTNMGAYSSILPPLVSTVAGYSVTVKNDLSGFEYSDVTGSGGDGDVFGPGSSTTNAIAKFGDTTGKLIANSGLLIGGAGLNNLEVRPAASVGEVRFYELAANGTNYVALKAPNNKVGDNTYTLPASDGPAGYVLSTDGSGTLSWVDNSSGTGITTTVVNTNTSMLPNTRYIVSGGPINLTLPVTISVGEEIEILGTVATFSILQNGSQFVRFGLTTTTTGVGGSITSLDIGSAIRVVCTVANTEFQVTSGPLGNFDII